MLNEHLHITTTQVASSSAFPSMECVSVTGKSVLLPSAFTGNTNIVLIAVRDSAWASLEMYRSHVNANIFHQFY